MSDCSADRLLVSLRSFVRFFSDLVVSLFSSLFLFLLDGQGYVEIQPVNKIIFILKPVTQHPINVLLDTSIVFDAREIYSLEDNETDKQLHGEFK